MNLNLLYSCCYTSLRLLNGKLRRRKRALSCKEFKMKSGLVMCGARESRKKHLYSSPIGANSFRHPSSTPPNTAVVLKSNAMHASHDCHGRKHSPIECLTIFSKYCSINIYCLTSRYKIAACQKNTCKISNTIIILTTFFFLFTHPASANTPYFIPGGRTLCT